MGDRFYLDGTGMDHVDTDSKGKCGYSRDRDTIGILEGGEGGDWHPD